MQFRRGRRVDVGRRGRGLARAARGRRALDDGLGDLAEGAYERFNCPDGTSGTDCGCATQASCTIPREHFYVVLPFNGPPVERDLEFGTDIRVADVFFVTDITGSMSGTLDRVQATVGTPGTGLIDRISATIPEAWFGGGYFQDFPFGSYGGGTDEAFGLAIATLAVFIAAAFAQDAGFQTHAWVLFFVLAIATLMIGGTVQVSDGLDYPLLRRLLMEEKLSNLIFFPGMVGQVLDELARGGGCGSLWNSSPRAGNVM